MKILFICTGNTCRSPMAEGILRDRLKDNKDIIVESAGVFAYNGGMVSQYAIEVLKDMEIDISNLRSKSINSLDLKDWDLILTMTNSHKESLIEIAPNIKDKVYTLKEYAYGKKGDIMDPFGRGKNAYEIAKEEILMAIDEIIKKLDI